MFEIINAKDLNEYDVNTCHNGGGYHQYEVSFVIEGIKGIYRNTSCGDFGDRVTIEIKKEGGKKEEYKTVYLFDQVDGGGVTNYSLLPLKELKNLQKESGFYIPTYWIKKEGGIPLKAIVKEERKEVKEIIFNGQKLLIEKVFLGDYVQETTIKTKEEGHTIYNHNALPWGKRWSLLPKVEQRLLKVPVVGTKKTIPVKGLSEYFHKGVIYSTEW